MSDQLLMSITGWRREMHGVVVQGGHDDDMKEDADDKDTAAADGAENDGERHALHSQS